MFAAAHFQTALQLVQTYRGEVPFAHFLKAYFSQHKKHGSRDRKQISQCCYAFFRMGHAIPDIPPERRMLMGLFFSATEPNPLLEALSPEWNAAAGLALAEKIGLSGLTPEALTIFPWTNLLSDPIDSQAFSISHLVQPKLFIRIRPGHHEQVIHRLEEKWIPYTEPYPFAIALPNGYNAANDFSLNREIVVQDLSSQKTGAALKLIPRETYQQPSFRIWDACAASGGKSMLTLDQFPQATLTVSDIRNSILDNLATRFKEAGIRRYTRIEADLSVTAPDLPQQQLIIADLPCTGSGTWARTPEQLCFFDPAAIGRFAELQRSISRNILLRLASGGFFLYITCSAFRAENEDNVLWLQQHFPLEVVHQEVIGGYTEQADSMFFSLMRLT
ncbi:hypothetical protein [Flavihumibacter petaseus]|uniref:Putative methyltransferase n=1 Tax=Flavihumibacter petaseus NBRC 106054 TaxID=1220578 RepID=A0A0E9MTY1_9BACT|nr:hypothetical protein [Flavihumibacter petaseus]GAO41237.1 putative methyltransferase [Flavihumibacter petaseus NBRC 106054]